MPPDPGGGLKFFDLLLPGCQLVGRVDNVDNQFLVEGLGALKS